MYFRALLIAFSFFVVSLVSGCKPAVDISSEAHEYGNIPLMIGCNDNGLQVLYLISVEPKHNRAVYRHSHRTSQNSLKFFDVKASTTDGIISESEYIGKAPECGVGKSIYSIGISHKPEPKMSDHFDEINYPGNNIDTVKNISSPDVCSLLCKENSECRYWGWRLKETGNNDKHHCWLKNQKSIEKVNDSVISGEKIYQ